jgi:hypothetical protein
MTRYPSLYTDVAYLEQLWQLYDGLGLYGFILDEAKRLLEAEQATPQYERVLLRWHAHASEKLLRRE